MSEPTKRVRLPLLADCPENFFAALGLLAVAERWDAERGDGHDTKLAWSATDYAAFLVLPYGTELSELQAFMDDGELFLPRFFFQPGTSDCPTNGILSGHKDPDADSANLERWASWGWDVAEFRRVFRSAKTSGLEALGESLRASGIAQAEADRDRSLVEADRSHADSIASARAEAATAEGEKAEAKAAKKLERSIAKADKAREADLRKIETRFQKAADKAAKRSVVSDLPKFAVGGHNWDGLVEAGYLQTLDELASSASGLFEDLTIFGSASKPLSSSPWTNGGNVGRACLAGAYLSALEQVMSGDEPSVGFFDGVDTLVRGAKSVGSIYSPARYGFESNAATAHKSSSWRTVLLVEGLALFQPREVVMRTNDATGEAFATWGFPWARGPERWIALWSQPIPAGMVRDELCGPGACKGSLSDRLDSTSAGLDIFAVLSDRLVDGLDGQNAAPTFTPLRQTEDVMSVSDTPLERGDLDFLSAWVAGYKREDRLPTWPRLTRRSKAEDDAVAARKDEDDAASREAVASIFLSEVDDGSVEFAVAACLVGTGGGKFSIRAFLDGTALPGVQPLSPQMSEQLVRLRAEHICVGVRRGEINPRYVNRLHTSTVAALASGDLGFREVGRFIRLLLLVEPRTLSLYLAGLRAEESEGVPIHLRSGGRSRSPFGLRALCGTDPVSLRVHGSEHRFKPQNRVTPLLHEVHFGGRAPTDPWSL